MTTETITRKDGITYTRRKREKLDCRLNARVYKRTIDKLKSIASFRGIKYQNLVREILEEYVDNYEKVQDRKK